MPHSRCKPVSPASNGHQGSYGVVQEEVTRGYVGLPQQNTPSPFCTSLTPAKHLSVICKPLLTHISSLLVSLKVTPISNINQSISLKLNFSDQFYSPFPFHDMGKTCCLLLKEANAEIWNSQPPISSIGGKNRPSMFAHAAKMFLVGDFHTFEKGNVYKCLPISDQSSITKIEILRMISSISEQTNVLRGNIDAQSTCRDLSVCADAGGEGFQGQDAALLSPDSIASRLKKS